MTSLNSFPKAHYDYCLNFAEAKNVYRQRMENPFCVVFGASDTLVIEDTDDDCFAALAELWAQSSSVYHADQNTLLPVDEAWRSEAISMWMYKKYGQPMFLVDTLLQEAFSHTSLKGITEEDINLPYPCFYVNLRNSNWFLLGPGSEDGYADTGSNPEYEVRGFYVRSTVDGQLNFLLHCEDGWLYHVCLSFKEAFRKHDNLEDYITELFQRSESDTSHHKMNEDNLAYCAEMSRWVLRLTIALLFYINKDGADLIEYREHHEKLAEAKERLRRVKSPKKRRALQRRITNLTEAKVIYVGKREQEELMKGVNPNMPRHWRRGHFHRYWEGKKKNPDGTDIPVSEWSERRKLIRKWVLPTLINPQEEVTDVARVYVFEEATYSDKQQRLVEETSKEGTLSRVVLNKYERNQKHRKSCIAHYGTTCTVCDMDFKEVYGSEAEGLIHVHHLVPVSKIGEIGEDYEFDPIRDLRPLCPNCHAVAHRKEPPFTIEELVSLIK